MAVVQISKIQVRRGRANSGSGLPQLGSGELGWAIDTQKIYIGNGSISEGAPFVGNTEILTENSNILSLAGQYIFKQVENSNIQTGPNVSTPIARPLQERLDENINAVSFGAIGDGIYDIGADSYSGTTDDTQALQRAINELFFKNDASAIAGNRVVLTIGAGIFLISNSIKVPPYTTIRGAGKDKTIIVQTGNFPVFETVGSKQIGTNAYITLADMTAQNQPRNIDVSYLTLRTTVNTHPVLLLDSTVNSTFNNVKFAGSFVKNAEISTRNDSGVELRATSQLVTSEKNLFADCDFVKVSRGINSNYDIKNNTFDNCKFEVLGEGASLGRVLTNTPGRILGPVSTNITNSVFIEVDKIGINVAGGHNNLSQSNRFINVGNEGGNSNTATYPVIYFGNGSNVSDNDMFERSIDLSYQSGVLLSSTKRYIGEVGGKAKSNHKYNIQVPIVQTTSAGTIDLLKLPGASMFGTLASDASSIGIRVHYFYNSPVRQVARRGVLNLAVSVSGSSRVVKMSDEFDVSGTVIDLERLTLFAELRNQPDSLGALDGINETVFIKYNNPINDNGYFNYWYEIIS